MFNFGPTFFFDKDTGKMIYMLGSITTTEENYLTDCYNFIPTLVSWGREDVIEKRFPAERKDLDYSQTARLNVDTGVITIKVIDYHNYFQDRETAEKELPNYPFDLLNNTLLENL